MNECLDTKFIILVSTGIVSASSESPAAHGPCDFLATLYMVTCLAFRSSCGRVCGVCVRVAGQCNRQPVYPAGRGERQVHLGGTEADAGYGPATLWNEATGLFVDFHFAGRPHDQQHYCSDFRRYSGSDLDVYDVSGLTLQVGALGGGERSRLQLPSGGSFLGGIIGLVCGVYALLLPLGFGPESFHFSQSAGDDIQGILFPEVGVEEFQAHGVVVAFFFQDL